MVGYASRSRGSATGIIHRRPQNCMDEEDVGYHPDGRQDAEAPVLPFSVPVMAAAPPSRPTPWIRASGRRRCPVAGDRLPGGHALAALAAVQRRGGGCRGADSGRLTKGRRVMRASASSVAVDGAGRRERLLTAPPTVRRDRGSAAAAGLAGASVFSRGTLSVSVAYSRRRPAQRSGSPRRSRSREHPTGPQPAAPFRTQGLGHIIALAVGS